MRVAGEERVRLLERLHAPEVKLAAGLNGVPSLH